MHHITQVQGKGHGPVSARTILQPLISKKEARDGKKLDTISEECKIWSHSSSFVHGFLQRQR